MLFVRWNSSSVSFSTCACTVGSGSGIDGDRRGECSLDLGASSTGGGESLEERLTRSRRAGNKSRRTENDGELDLEELEELAEEGIFSMMAVILTLSGVLWKESR